MAPNPARSAPRSVSGTITEGARAFCAGTPYASHPPSDSASLGLWRQGWRDAFVAGVQNAALDLMDRHGHRAAGTALEQALEQSLVTDESQERYWLAVASEVMLTQALYR